MLKILKFMVVLTVITLKKKNRKIKISNRFKKNVNLEKNFGIHKFSCYQNFSKK